MIETRHIRALDAGTLAGLADEALHTVSVRLRPDVLAALGRAWQREGSERGRLVLSILLENAQQAALESVAPCQDTGAVWLCLTVGRDREGRPLMLPSDVFAQVNAIVEKVWGELPLRASLVADALCQRVNTRHNTPAFCELHLDPALVGARLDVMVKGAGSDNASALAMLPPGAGWPGIADFVVAQVAAKAANACPPLLVGVGIGGTFDKVAGLSKQALLREIKDSPEAPAGLVATTLESVPGEGFDHPEGRPADYAEGRPAGRPADHPEGRPAERLEGRPADYAEELAAKEAELLARINALGIGPGGLGGDTTALALHIMTAPCHMAALPVAVNLGCCAQRSISYRLLVGDEQCS